LFEISFKKPLLQDTLPQEINQQNPNPLPEMCTDRYTFYACGCHKITDQQFKVCEHVRMNESLAESSSKQYQENEKKCEEDHKVERVALGQPCKDCEQKMIERRIEENKGAAEHNHGLSSIKE
jgi:hypothetical protein